ncbi:MAG: hypothetical protein ACE5FP_08055, partial [Gemmatimonadota bacterium]
MNRPVGGSKESRVFLWTGVVLVCLYVAFRFVAPRLTMWLGLSPAPAPIPRFALGIYMVSAVVGALIYVS